MFFGRYVPAQVYNNIIPPRPPNSINTNLFLNLEVLLYKLLISIKMLKIIDSAALITNKHLHIFQNK
jgi:hypothetical protein